MSLEVRVKKKLGSFSLDVDFRCDKETMGLLGASGSGKSMTLRCIAGIETPDDGRIVLNGKVLFDKATGINLRPQKRGVGYLFQSYALFPHMTVAQNIVCALSDSTAQKRRRLSEMLDLFRLSGMENRYPAQLSGGEQQRVALARIFASKPDVLLLDEPFSALDSYLREQLEVELLDFLRGYGGDTVLVSHSRDEIYRLCKSLAVLDNGTNAVNGATKEIFANPRTLAAARLTGCKNISRAKYLGNNEIDAFDWGIRLKIPNRCDEEISFIGIRAHDFTPVGESADNIENLIPMRIQSVYESPFELNAVFKASDTSAPIWWKYPKADIPHPAFLHIAPEKILLLKG